VALIKYAETWVVGLNNEVAQIVKSWTDVEVDSSRNRNGLAWVLASIRFLRPGIGRVASCRTVEPAYDSWALCAKAPILKCTFIPLEPSSKPQQFILPVGNIFGIVK